MTVDPRELRSYRKTGKPLFITEKPFAAGVRLDFYAGRVSLEHSKEHSGPANLIDLTGAVGYTFPGDEIYDRRANFFSIDLSRKGLTATGDFDDHKRLVTGLMTLRMRQRGRVRFNPPQRLGEYLSRAYILSKAPAELITR